MPPAKRAESELTSPPLTVVGSLRYDLIRRTLRKLDGVSRILEIGPGVGGVGARLASTYEYVGVEQDESSAAIARSRIERFGGQVLHGTTADFDLGAFDLVCAFEVLEHIEDDEAALSAWRDLTRPDGWVMVSVPAWPKRFGPYDELAGHLRRYDRASLEGLAARVGLEDARTFAYGFPLANIAQFLWNGIARRTAWEGSAADMTAKSGRWMQPGASSGRARERLTAPFALLQARLTSTSLGVGLILVARRPADVGQL